MKSELASIRTSALQTGYQTNQHQKMQFSCNLSRPLRVVEQAKLIPNQHGINMRKSGSQQIVKIDSNSKEFFKNGGGTYREKYRAACPLTPDEAMATWRKLYTLGIWDSSSEDVAADACLLALEQPDLNTANLIAILVNRAKQSRSRSIVCTKSMSTHLDGHDSIVFDLAAPEPEELERWRTAEINIDIDTLRACVRKTGGFGDRRARQVINTAIEKLESEQPDLFGFAERQAV